LSEYYWSVCESVYINTGAFVGVIKNLLTYTASYSRRTESSLSPIKESQVFHAVYTVFPGICNFDAGSDRYDPSQV
jgi:hypothetical protein